MRLPPMIRMVAAIPKPIVAAVEPDCAIVGVAVAELPEPETVMVWEQLVVSLTELPLSVRIVVAWNVPAVE